MTGRIDVAEAQGSAATLGDARRAAVLAARLARRAGVTLTEAVLEQQERLRADVLPESLS